MKKLHQFFIFLSIMSPLFCLSSDCKKRPKPNVSIVIPTGQPERCPIPPTPSPRK